MTISLAVIPVAGRGTRLLPLTKSQPKEMLPVGRKPVVQYIVEELAGCGVDRMLFITGPGKTAIENHFDIDAELIENLRGTGREDLLRELAFERSDVEYFYTRQRRQLGLGHAILCAETFVEDRPFVVALGDSIIGHGAESKIVRQMTDLFETELADFVVALERVPRDEVSQYGIVEPKASPPGDVFELADIVEKPEVENAPSDLAVAARYVFSPRIFHYLARTEPGKGGEIQLTDAMRQMIRDGGKAIGVCLPPGEDRYDIGHFESYFQAFVEFALADADHGLPLRQWLQERLGK